MILGTGEILSMLNGGMERTTRSGRRVIEVLLAYMAVCPTRTQKILHHPILLHPLLRLSVMICRQKLWFILTLSAQRAQERVGI